VGRKYDGATTMTDVKARLDAAFDSVLHDHDFVQGLYNHVAKIEGQYQQIDDEPIATAQSSSSSSSSSIDSESDASDQTYTSADDAGDDASDTSGPSGLESDPEDLESSGEDAEMDED